MPRYDYKCPKCGTLFEVVHKMKDRHVAKCPKCGAKAERQLSGGHGIVFKGTGFYETDYKRKGEKHPEQEGSKDSPKKPSGPSAPSAPSGSSGASGLGGSPPTSGSRD